MGLLALERGYRNVAMVVMIMTMMLEGLERRLLITKSGQELSLLMMGQRTPLRVLPGMSILWSLRSWVGLPDERPVVGLGGCL